MPTMVIDNGFGTPTDRVFGATRFDGSDVLIDADQFTRVVLHIDALVLDSNDIGLGAGQPFDPTEEIEMTINGKTETKRLLRMRLGDQGIPAGTYTGKLVCYDGSHPNGMVWDRGFSVKVIG